jgi:hypothetical membrane protein
MVSPWFDWNRNALSDFGLPPRASAPIFNAGLTAAGALYLVFILGLRRDLPRSWMARVAAVFLVGGALSLSGIGVFNESFGDLHLYVSSLYFGLTPMGLGFVSGSLRRDRKLLASLTFGLGAVAAAFGLLIVAAMNREGPFTSAAIPELLASITLALWSGATAGLMLQGPLLPVQPAK